MKIKFRATGQAPDFYSFDGDKITPHIGGFSQEIDFTGFANGDEWQGFEEPEIEGMASSQVIFDVYRDGVGELHVTLSQAAPMQGHWRESHVMDVSEYVAGRRYIRELKDGELIDPVFEEVENVDS